MGKDRASLMLVRDLSIITQNWGVYSHGLECVFEKATGDTSLSLVYEQLLTGQMQLWLCYIGTEMVGFCTTRYVDVPQGERYVTVSQAYLKPGIHYTALLEAMDDIIDVAKKYGYGSVRFYTTRDKAFEKKMGSDGWERGYTEFIKNVKEE